MQLWKCYMKGLHLFKYTWGFIVNILFFLTSYLTAFDLLTKFTSKAVWETVDLKEPLAITKRATHVANKILLVDVGLCQGQGQINDTVLTLKNSTPSKQLKQQSKRSFCLLMQHHGVSSPFKVKYILSASE